MASPTVAGVSGEGSSSGGKEDSLLYECKPCKAGAGNRNEFKFAHRS